ncbi:DivIVA domain-containing protein [Actinomadura scrupuli]|uniref:DivIVA domain-containing protein n=1 Tax=Actinomadura scrupuli TaxID=559629 RepID=UPI003D97A5B9
MNDGHGHGHGQPEQEHPGAAAMTSAVPYAVRRFAHGHGMGWLSPAEVRGQVFTTVRLREGYEMGEVDTFLDKVEATLDAVLADNQDLRSQLSLAEQAVAQAAARAAKAPAPNGDAGRIVAFAQQAADQAIIAAQQEAAGILARARERAEVMVRQSLDQGARMRESLETQARQLQGLLRELDAGDEASPATPAPPFHGTDHLNGDR